MTSFEDQKKQAENFPVGTEVIYEVDDIKDDTTFPYRYGKVSKIILPNEKAKVKIVYVEIDSGGKKVKVVPANISRICQKDDINVTDMAEVSPINTKDLLANIKNRYDKDIIFTNVGDTLIITNPYQIIPGLYTEEKMIEIIKYSNDNSVDRYMRKEPHCFDTTMNAIFDLCNEKKNQALVISGESGAGKTECAKLCMKFIAYFFGKKGENGEKAEPSLEDKILGCNPVLEAFGNAKTVRNDNSSRFGKYIKIFIKISQKTIIGAFMETYLLEKSRVVTIAQGERNYHIFYMIVVGLNKIIDCKFNLEAYYKELEGKRLKLDDTCKKFITDYLTEANIKDLYDQKDLKKLELSNFHYLKNDIYTVEKIDDSFNFFECLQGMVSSGFKPEEMWYTIKITMAILWTGNIEFTKEDKSNVTPQTEPIRNKVCSMLGMDINVFKEAFILNVREVNKEIIKSPLDQKNCEIFRDTFAKEIYDRLFNYLVERMNQVLFDEEVRKACEDDPDVQHIGLLDIFGFECFKENSFEQFCINYANEKLQNLYVQDIFKEIENMFKREGLEQYYSSIDFKDNQIILDAMGKKPSGIFFVVDDTCKANGVDSKVASAIMNLAKTNISIEKKRQDLMFTIKHTAKNVEYSVANWVDKNKDEFKRRMKESVETMKDELLIKMVGEKPEDTKKEKFLGSKFRVDMDNLAHALGECVRHYIRCLKPNEKKKKNFFVPWFSLLQIKYMGVLDTIRVRQEGYPVIKTHLEYYLKYEDAVDWPGKLFYKMVQKDNPSLLDWCKTIANKLVPDHSEDGILFGHSLILLRQAVADQYDLARRKQLEVKEKMVTLLSNKYRGVEPLQSFHLFYGAVFTLQQNYKLFAYINKMNKVRDVCRILQTKSRMETIKSENMKFTGKLKKLGTLFKTTAVRKGYEKQINKLYQCKYIMSGYVLNFKHKKYLKYKALVRKIIEARIENYIKSDMTQWVEYLQRRIRGYLARVHMGEIYNSIVKRKNVIKEELRVKKIQKHFRKHFCMNNVINLQKAVDKFRGLMFEVRFKKVFYQVREKAVIIQRSFKRYYYKKKIITARLAEFTDEEDLKFEDANFVTSATLFPDRQLETNPNEKGSQATVQKMEKMKKFYDKKVKALNPTKLNQQPYLNHSPYDDPKLNFFAHILDLDCIINIDDIYTLIPWCETFDEVNKHNIKSNTPIQLIEIGEFHTTLVNSLGKTFTWGWDGNGQCGFNMDKDKNFLYDNFKRSEKGVDGNVMKEGGINDDIDGGVDMDIDFDAEIENIKEEKEIFENEEENEEDDVLDLQKYIDNYYLVSPVIIDNFIIRKVSCGPDNTMVLTKDEKLYVFGANSYYQLGVLKSRNIYAPMSLTNIIKTQQENPAVNTKSNIKAMKFSGKNGILINDQGSVILLSCFCAGASGPDALYRTPMELPISDVKFVDVQCGKDFALLLTENGQLYSFGSNQFGQLGHGDTEARNFPTIVKFFLDKKIRVQQVSCGFKHAAAKAGNKVYTWGCNVCGQLGTGGLTNKETPTLNDIKFSKMKNNFLQVSCGFRCTTFLTETRQIFWCGTCGDIQQQTVPIEFDYGMKIPELFSYDNYTIVKINHTWSKTMSLFYATVAETGPLKLKLNNPNKLNQILNNLTNKWTTMDLYPPDEEQFYNYIADKHLFKQSMEDNKNKKKK